MDRELKFYTLIGFIIITMCSSAFSASYLGMKNGSISEEVDSFDSSGEEIKKKLPGSTFGIEVGHFLTNSVAIELGYTSVKQKQMSINESTPVAYGYETDGEMSIINLGFRWFLADSFNIRYGGIKTDYNPHLKGSGALSSLKNEIITSRGQYYGAGLGYTMNKLQLFFDYTVFPNEDGENSESSNIGLRLFY
jgi:hypothetical protein